MEKLGKVFLASLGGLLYIAFFMILGVLVAPLSGALMGIVFQYCFPACSVYILKFTGLTAMYKIGAILGFVGSFFVRVTQVPKTTT